MAEENHSYENQYSDKGFWGKVVAFARIAGKEVIEKALWLYYASQQPRTPADQQHRLSLLPFRTGTVLGAGAATGGVPASSRDSIFNSSDRFCG